MENQQTIASPISFSGVGLHTGATVSLKVLPAAQDTGIIFRRVDLDNFEIEATIKNVAHVSYATTLLKQGVLISTVEHLLSSLYIFGVDNAVIELDNLEVPILDGSALEFVKEIQRVGLKAQKRPKTYFFIEKPIHLRERGKTISVYPANHFQVSYTIDFAHPLIGKQTFDFEATPWNFAAEIAPARTFGFLDEVEELRRSGLVRGGSLENAIVLTKTGILNDILRFKDEFVRHKILDNIGDLSLIGAPLIGRIVAEKAGHALHTRLVSRILSNPKLYRKVTFSQLKEIECSPELSAQAVK
ncbi:MAG: UDP-3-O-acyl-N-acetylglucosamine deacetylase [Terriglobia bacterium]